MPDAHYSPAALRAFATTLLAKAGMPEEPATAPARGLVEADLYGHTTHGLALLAGYVEEIDNGAMTLQGRPQVIADHGAVACWDAMRLSAWMPTTCTVSPVAGIRSAKLTASTGVSPSCRGS